MNTSGRVFLFLLNLNPFFPFPDSLDEVDYNRVVVLLLDVECFSPAVWCNFLLWTQQLKYSGTSLKRTLMGQQFLSALERCPPWRGLNWKVLKSKVRLFYTGPTLIRTSPLPYLTMGMWNGEKEVMFFVMYHFILHQRLK